MVIKREGRDYVVYKDREEMFRGASFDHARWFMEKVVGDLGSVDDVGHVDLFGEYDPVGVDLVRKDNDFRNRSDEYRIVRRGRN